MGSCSWFADVREPVQHFMVQGVIARCHLPRSVLSANLTHASPARKMLPALKIWALFSLSLGFLSQPGHLKKAFRCPSTCSCSRESIICVGSSHVPRIAPNEISSLWVPSMWFFFYQAIQTMHACAICSKNSLIKFDSTCPWLYFRMCTILIRADVARQCSPDSAPPSLINHFSAFHLLQWLHAHRFCFHPFRSIVNGTFSEVREAMFAHIPSLQLL